MKKKIAFALMMGIITTGIISFTVVGVNIGLSGNFMHVWFRSWFIGYVVVVPIILFIAPRIQKLADKMFKQKNGKIYII